MKMKLKKTLRAVSAAAVGAGAIMVLGLAGQSLALAQQNQMVAPYSDSDFTNGASDAAAFQADIGVLCGASQPFADASDPQWNCGETTRTYP